MVKSALVFFTVLHAIVPSHLLTAVGALMDDILGPIHAEGDQTTSKSTADHKQNEAGNPGHGARLKVGGRDNVCLTELALNAHRTLPEVLNHWIHGLLQHNSCVPLLAVTTRVTRWCAVVSSSWLLWVGGTSWLLWIRGIWGEISLS